jgi:hypothetical protein
LNLNEYRVSRIDRDFGIYTKSGECILHHRDQVTVSITPVLINYNGVYTAFYTSSMGILCHYFKADDALLEHMKEVQLKQDDDDFMEQNTSQPQQRTMDYSAPKPQQPQQYQQQPQQYQQQPQQYQQQPQQYQQQPQQYQQQQPQQYQQQPQQYQQHQTGGPIRVATVRPSTPANFNEDVPF